METMEPVVATDDKLRSARTLTMIIYGLYAASVLVGLTGIVAIIMNYVKKDDVAGTFLESHFRWQIRTFWFALMWAVTGVLTAPFMVGWLLLTANAVWFIYRIVKGFLNLNDNKPMYVV